MKRQLALAALLVACGNGDATRPIDAAVPDAGPPVPWTGYFAGAGAIGLARNGSALRFSFVNSATDCAEPMFMATIDGETATFADQTTVVEQGSGEAIHMICYELGSGTFQVNATDDSHITGSAVEMAGECGFMQFTQTIFVNATHAAPWRCN